MITNVAPGDFDVAEREVREPHNQQMVAEHKWVRVEVRDTRQRLVRLAEQQQAHRGGGMHVELRRREVTLPAPAVGHLFECRECRRRIALVRACSTNQSHERGAQQVGIQPRLGHCGEGPATDSFDAFSALVEWVEKGVPPDSILATVGAGNTDKPASWSATRSRPLCPYPAKAVLKAGASDLESAASFVCQ